MCTNQGCKGLIATKSINTDFLYYQIVSIIEELNNQGSGTTFRELSYQKLANLLFVYPDKSVQSKIVAYLDLKVGFIDQIIEKKKKLIEQLKEKRTAIINQAVTKGLDPKVELVDSGIDWIGKIPKGWKLERLKYIAPERNKKIISSQNSNKYIGLENIESNTGNFFEIESEIQPGSVLNKFSNGDILFGKLRPYLAKVYASDFDGVSTGELLDLVPNQNKVIQRYLFYKLISRDFIKIVSDSTYGAKMPRASGSFIGNQKICFPSISQQGEIVLLLDNKTKVIDEIIKIVSRSMERLVEYKSSLISNVVTGKVKV